MPKKFPKISEIPVESETAFGLVELAVGAITLAWALDIFAHALKRDTKTTLNQIKVYLLNLIEAAMWAGVYSVLAIWLAAIPELVFSKWLFPLNPEAKWPQLLLEVVLQAAANGAISQVVVDLASQIPVPDLGADGKKLSASGGGVIFAFLLFSRQGAWKAKIAALDTNLDKKFQYGLPLPIVKLLLGFISGGAEAPAVEAQ
eukprot:CAMPEP_0172612220 /NCGR_PEP_ID=MMETSP1068-20121228/31779_1 /TAXON_ID=35684 /ORGANISM="Pseudopedinella elastica, Strain CCMP716" /LENGTH=201 /DNA_ID=CAMNT_0013416371 /DNA_START=73 /DNA_END=678 /DNA_ORIENTATION=-